jgi:hypothetical protein
MPLVTASDFKLMNSNPGFVEQVNQALLYAQTQDSRMTDVLGDAAKTVGVRASSPVSFAHESRACRYRPRQWANVTWHKKVACSFQATEKDDLEPLLDILANAGLVESREPEDDDVRIVVYLLTRNGETARLVTGPDYTNAPASRRYNRSTPIAVKSAQGRVRRRDKDKLFGKLMRARFLVRDHVSPRHQPKLPRFNQYFFFAEWAFGPARLSSLAHEGRACWYRPGQWASVTWHKDGLSGLQHNLRYLQLPFW